jgi:cell division protein FtsB
VVRRGARLTARAAILAVVLGALAVTLALPVKVFVSQRHTIDQLAVQTRQQVDQVARLRRQLADWQYPWYVEIQARERLHYVFPDEVNAIMYGAPLPPEPVAARTARTTKGPWYQALWRSIEQPPRAAHR